MKTPVAQRRARRTPNPKVAGSTPAGSAILQAKSLSVDVCEHGSIHLHMHDAKGNIFASACLSADNFCNLSGQVVDDLHAYHAGKLTSQCDRVH